MQPEPELRIAFGPVGVAGLLAAARRALAAASVLAAAGHVAVAADVAVPALGGLAATRRGPVAAGTEADASGPAG